MPENIDNIQQFNNEAAFENALCELLLQHGWNEILNHPSEEDLVKNWAQIIYDNNRGINQLGNWPLTESEMQQIIDKVDMCETPYQINNFINGQEVCIKRDNTDDTNNFGKEIYLKIFDAQEISSGQSRYQIAKQPRFKAAHPLAGNRRGDLMLLINGMPVIHIELKRSGVDVSQAAFQLKRYTHEGVFAHGIFSMVQIFVAMTPNKTLYFANPGSEDRFVDHYYFHWANTYNVEIHDWKQVAADLISIPMAHMLVGFFTIADDKDKSLKVLRSYQYYAVNKISDKVRLNTWDEHQHRGGYIWHTTGSGKTMTSFKSAQLVSDSGDADKVVFLLDRIELGVQSLDEYRGFAGDPDSVQDTQDTSVLVAKLKSNDKDDALIVTSIQKMANIAKNPERFAEDLKVICRKRLVFIIDECHRNVFGEMLLRIKRTFSRALLFGFTGTPVFPENAHDEIVTADIFGDELHKYTIGHAIPDGNVLGFDPYMMVLTEDDDLRDRAARYFLGIQSVDEIADNEEKMATYNRFMNELPMEADYLEDGKFKHGIEFYLPKDFYKTDIHHQKVAADIVESHQRLSINGKFHAMLATKSIPEAIEYYHIFKKDYPSLNVVAIFDENIDNSDEGIFREDAILEMLDDYNQKYSTSFQLSTYQKYKKDAGKRLAHKKPYTGIDNDHSQQIDLLIVVSQMLTGYDSKWINTLYVDKVMKYVDIIQSFSRTNRLFGDDKPHGTIKYYTMPYTMRQNIQDALEVYVDRPEGVFVDHLEVNLTRINSLFSHIKSIFESFGIKNFEKLPESRESRNMFAKDFANMTHTIKAAKLQGFMWDQTRYEFQHEDTYTYVDMLIDEETYNVLLARYRELFGGKGGGGGHDDSDFDYPIDSYIAQIGTGTIDAEYLNSKFVLYVRNLYTDGPEGELTKKAKADLCKSFAGLSQKDQRTALLIIHDIQFGKLRLEIGKTILDYITDYQLRDIHKLVVLLGEATGINISQLDNIIKSDVNDQNLNQFNRYDNLRLTVDNVKAKTFIKKVTGEEVPPRLVTIKFEKLLRQFILDSEKRDRIMKAYLNDDIFYDVNQTVVPEDKEEVEDIPDSALSTPIATIVDPNLIKTNISVSISTQLAGVAKYMRRPSEIVDCLYYILKTPSVDTLDGVGIYVEDALNKLFGRQPNFVEKMTSFHQLVTQFEAFAKKLYYLINNSEIQPQYGEPDVTWKDIIKAHLCLRGLKNNPKDCYQQLYQCLEIVRSLRNSQSHVSPTASDQEVDNALRTVLTMYYFLVGSSITDLESNGHDF
ncbi:MAG: HsdR family type I site-specific deoxyribonuclease [Bacteroidaceae bacterium]|nr:HsdR family type I site-specific deoxyribonuclease [Bacteroidaceae bacterium]